MRTPLPSRPAPWRAPTMALVVAAALALAACHHAPPTGNATPATAVEASLRLAALGDFDGLVKNRLPPDDYAIWRQQWQHAHDEPAPASSDSAAQFAALMGMLTAPDAEAKLAKQLEPQLAGMKGGAGQPMPIFASIFQASIQQMISASPQLGPPQKQLARQGLDALMAWTATVDFSNMKKAREAIAIACATARGLHVETLDQWRALDYAQTMQAYGSIWTGVEKIMAVYGLGIAKSLNGAKVDVVSTTADTAVVRLKLEFAGQPLAGEWPMRKVAGHWYDADLLTAWAKAHPIAAASTEAPPAMSATTPPAVSLPAAASTARTPPPSSPRR
ncbi:MAG TPA: hypothetical protein VFQ95_06845 [Rhodanobacteraceae bacterium]|nr:hypothetical protein [Rhodanobacteraceae bacterium]